MSVEPAWSLGIEEEYLLVERDSGAPRHQTASGLAGKSGRLTPRAGGPGIVQFPD